MPILDFRLYTVRIRASRTKNAMKTDGKRIIFDTRKIYYVLISREDDHMAAVQHEKYCAPKSRTHIVPNRLALPILGGLVVKTINDGGWG